MKIAEKLSIFIVVIVVFTTITFAQVSRNYTDEEAKKSGVLFEEGNNLMEQNKFQEALVKYKESLAVVPDSLGPLYNGGVAAFSIKNYKEAILMWKRIKELDPEDWQVRTKIIQTYQSLEMFSERDLERKELFDLRKSGEIEELNKTDFYTREQTELAGKKIMVFEHFELKGDRALRYAFYILKDDGKPEFSISLGSYETTNAIWRETEKRKPEERLFHLDGYFQNGHSTYGMYEKEPTYDETREMVRKILEKEKNPISSSTRSQ